MRRARRWWWMITLAGLWAAGCEVRGGASLLRAIDWGNRGYVREFVQRHPDQIDKPLLERYTPLILAIGEGRRQIAMDLVLAGADVNANRGVDMTPLQRAVERDDTAMVEFLLEHGADPDIAGGRDKRPLHVVRSAAMANLLIRRGADVNARDKVGYTPLHVGTDYGVAKMLLEHGADVHARIQIGYQILGGTPLHSLMTLRTGPEVVELLIEHGADVNARTWGETIVGQRTPLHLAAWFSSPEVVALLIRKGAEVNARSYHGDTPLNVAVRRGRGDTAHVLMEAGADVTIANRSGETPLKLAAWRRMYVTAERLLELGADPTVASKDAASAVWWAQQYRDKRLLTLFRKYGYRAGD